MTHSLNLTALPGAGQPQARLRRQRSQVLGLLGVLGSLFWLSLNTVLSPEWGPPGSSDYLGYETINRLWAPAFALMLCGYAGLYASRPLGTRRLGRAGFRLVLVGGVAMIAGNIAEFWFFTDLPYGALNVRSLAWIGVLVGWLVLHVGAALLGLAALRHNALPHWSAFLFILALPASIILIFTLVDLMGLPLVIAGLVAGGLAAWPGPRQMAAQPAA